jgi:hypothetical protein
MGLWGKGNREAEQGILDAREETEQAKTTWVKALFGKKMK